MISLETTDIFRGAFLLTSGGDLAEVRVRTNGKRMASFLITGKDLDRLDRDYRCGRALVNRIVEPPAGRDVQQTEKVRGESKR